MDFFNSLLIRMTLAVIGGIFYAFLTYLIVMLVNLPYEFVILASVFVYLFYLASRLLLLFSGIDSPYYSKGRKTLPKTSIKENYFYNTAQWVGKFYHQHDLVLFVFLGILSIAFLISLVMDGLSGSPFGNTARDLWNTLLPPS
ncbi:MAG TPA: hypothetical protein VEK32_22055 [Thermodesulfobacteriota bacterium]|nr:hypothetical protein [Thermodesulfobacteriota bacterium]